jgi:selenocysteine lyase/cysteine desulfurase
MGLLTANIKGMNRGCGAILDADFGIAVRVGLHCPAGARNPRLLSGVIRFSPGPFNTRMIQIRP